MWRVLPREFVVVHIPVNTVPAGMASASVGRAIGAQTVACMILLCRYINEPHHEKTKNVVSEEV